MIYRFDLFITKKIFKEIEVYRVIYNGVSGRVPLHLQIVDEFVNIPLHLLQYLIFGLFSLGLRKRFGYVITFRVHGAPEEFAAE